MIVSVVTLTCLFVIMMANHDRISYYLVLFLLNRPLSSSLSHCSTGITLPFIQITTEPGSQHAVAATAQPTLNDASESTNLSGFVAPVNAITKRGSDPQSSGLI